MSAAARPCTLKVDFRGEVRRLRGWPEDGSEPSFSSLRSAVSALFGFGHADAEHTSIKYRDNEGDLCTLNEATFPDALALAAEPPHTIKLVIDRALSARAVGLEQAPAREALPAPAPATSPASTVASSIAAPSDVGEVATSPDGGATGAGAAGGADGVRQQRLREGLARFSRQVSTDFSTACRDARDAFRPKSRPAQEGGSGVAEKVTAVPATLIGACVAARLAPVRLMRMTAHSVAAVAGRSVASDSDAADAAEGGSSSGELAEQEEEGALVTGIADAPAGLSTEFKHFVKQVAQDFQSAKADVKVAFTCIVGDQPPTVERPVAQEEQQQAQAPPPPQREGQEPEDTSGRAQEGEQELSAGRPEPPRPPQRPPRPWTARRAVPAAASTVAGVAVAGTLAPVRLVRLAIASVAVVASAAAGGHAEAATPVEQELAGGPEAEETAEEEGSDPPATSAEPEAASADPASPPEQSETSPDPICAEGLAAPEDGASKLASAEPVSQEDDPGSDAESATSIELTSSAHTSEYEFC